MTASHQPQIDLWERWLSNLTYRKQKNDAVPTGTPQWYSMGNPKGRQNPSMELFSYSDM